MDAKRNSIIIIHDYEYEHIKKIHEEANGFWTDYYENLTCTTCQIVSPIMSTASGNEYTFIINGNCFGTEINEHMDSHKTIENWCSYIYRKYIPQNIVVVTLSDVEASYIEYQFPNKEEYNVYEGVNNG